MAPKKKRSGGARASARKPVRASLVQILEHRSNIIAIVLVLFATVRIGLTYMVFNHTSDEPNHIVCGMELLQFGAYTFETQHPPLARLAVALGPYLIGARTQRHIKPDTVDVNLEGGRMLYRNHRYDLTLVLARLGILPFFWIACFVVYRWAARYHGPLTGVTALFLFSFTPPVLAHAGLATTDMALTAFVGAAFIAAILWIEQPTPRRALLFGVCCGLAAISKFLSLPFIPAGLACALVLYVAVERPNWRWFSERARRSLPSFGLAVLSGALVIWAGFRFSFGKVGFTRIPLPAPELFSGIESAAAHNRLGHHTYLLGHYSVKGFWYYYPVVLGSRRRLRSCCCFGLGLFLAARRLARPQRVWQPLGLIAGVLAIGFYSRINIGVRHILPVFMGMCLLAAIAAVRLPRLLPGSWGKAALAALLLWFAGSSLLAHPDYLPYFNELAGSEPEKIMVDSDLDWGQDIKRLGRRLQELHADYVSFRPTLTAIATKEHGLPPLTPQDPFTPSPGWNAVSLTYWKLQRMGLMYIKLDGTMDNLYPDRTLWPDRVPKGERVGKWILLWDFLNVEAAEGRATRPGCSEQIRLLAATD